MFRFTIRDVLWLTVVVALSVGWWADNERIETEVFRLQHVREAELTLLRELRAKQEQLVSQWMQLPPTAGSDTVILTPGQERVVDAFFGEEPPSCP